VRQQRHQQHRDETVALCGLSPLSSPYLSPSFSPQSATVGSSPVGLTLRRSHQTFDFDAVQSTPISMTFPPLDIFDPPQYNYNATNPRLSPPSTATTATTPFPSPNRPQTCNNSPRPRTASMTVPARRGPAAAKRSDTPAEFYIPVELYLSPKASVSLRKVCSSHFACSPPSPLAY